MLYRAVLCCGADLPEPCIHHVGRIPEFIHRLSIAQHASNTWWVDQKVVCLVWVARYEAQNRARFSEMEIHTC